MIRLLAYVAIATAVFFAASFVVAVILTAPLVVAL